MGATESRFQDERLQLPAPVHSTFAGRRVLDPSTGRCAVCRSVFIPIARKKHYCRRCSGIICEGCSTMRRYRESDGWTFRVCRPCAARPTIFDVMRQDEAPWRAIMEFAGDQVQHRVLQICHRAQLGFYLPFDHGRWDDLFAEQTYLAKGANGAVYRTVLRPETLARLAAAAAAVASDDECGGASSVAAAANVDPMSLLSAAARGHVAVKVVQKASIYSLRKWRHIERELMTLTRCRSPHVIELIGVFQSPEAVFIVMEYAQGGDLFDWLLARKKPTEAEVKNIAIQLLGTIFIMHERFGVVHRDIKPENILLRHKVRGSETPDLKFADFGFARHFEVRPMEGNAAIQQLLQSSSAAANAAPAAGALLAGRSRASGGSHGGGASVFDRMLLKATPCGTLGFAPPETVKAYNARKEDPAQSAAAPHTPVDHLKKMDIFALGVTIAILLTGQEPFTCHSSRAHIDAVNRGVNFNSRPWAYVSPAARNLLRRMLAPEAKDRPTALQCLQSEWIADTNAAVEYVQQALALPVPASVVPGGTVAVTGTDPSLPPKSPSSRTQSRVSPATTSTPSASGSTMCATATVVESPVEAGVVSSTTMIAAAGTATDLSKPETSNTFAAYDQQHSSSNANDLRGSSGSRGASVDEPDDVVQSFQQSVRSLRQSRLSQQAHASTVVLVADGVTGRVGIRSRDDARAEEVDSEGGTAVNSSGSSAGASAPSPVGRPPLPPQSGTTPRARAQLPLAPQRK